MTPTRPPAHAPPVLAYALRGALYLNITNSCTLACIFCPKIRDGEFRVGGHDLRLGNEPGVEEVWAAACAAGIHGRAEVVFTGLGESTRRFAVVRELVTRLAGARVQRIRIDTDGLASLREGRDVCPELAAAGLSAVSVSLNAPDAATYARVCPSRYGEAAYEAARSFIRSAVQCIPEVVASAVALPGLSEGECRRAVESLGARFRWRALNPPTVRSVRGP